MAYTEKVFDYIPQSALVGSPSGAWDTWPIHTLYNYSDWFALPPIAQTQLVVVGLSQGCPFSLIWFIIGMLDMFRPQEAC